MAVDAIQPFTPIRFHHYLFCILALVLPCPNLPSCVEQKKMFEANHVSVLISVLLFLSFSIGSLDMFGMFPFAAIGGWLWLKLHSYKVARGLDFMTRHNLQVGRCRESEPWQTAVSFRHLSLDF